MFQRHWASWWSWRRSATITSSFHLLAAFSYCAHAVCTRLKGRHSWALFSLQFQSLLARMTIPQCNIRRFVHLSYGIASWKHKHESRKEGRKLLCSFGSLPPFQHHFACTLAWSAFVLHASWRTRTRMFRGGEVIFVFIVPACLVKMTRFFFWIMEEHFEFFARPLEEVLKTKQ